MPDLMKEFLTLAIIHFLAVVAPGPDFAVTIRQSIRYGRRAGISTAIGIGAGISVHVVYTLLGVAALMHTTPWLLNVVEAFASVYLLYLGLRFISQATAHLTDNVPDAARQTNATSFRQSFMIGFLTNATNPKATLFFLAVFTTVVSASTALHIQVLYGVWMCIVNALWFIVVSLIFANPAVRRCFVTFGPWFERLMGLLLIVFSLRLIWHLIDDLL